MATWSVAYEGRTDSQGRWTSDLAHAFDPDTNRTACGLLLDPDYLRAEKDLPDWKRLTNVPRCMRCPGRHERP